MRRYHVWDPFLRLFHWSLVTLFALNALILDPESRLHRWVGYAVAALIGLRIVWGLIGPARARFADFLPTPFAVAEQIGDIRAHRRRAHLGHTPLGALMIVNILLTVIAIAVTGYMQTTLAYWGVGWVKELHEALVTWAELSVAAHVAAVIWESRRIGINLARAMITGDKPVPEGVEVLDLH
ncbi:cytochrome b/b6 domain-containing protein [Pararhodobacter aggregans]|uniref:Cytochrome B n=1 Tax=Pararhodobacter aggregans TaxID=404875 RepID=A0A2T7UVR2_9RHOB|nr:cytochrome b/b6 domain-containing protein [Pararhodobacter aggregans]PTX03852.1 cytochrome b [Pararhodobacter aggregans]PVE48668.1 cytochrome B [Pararhodobacter aggregans]